MLECCCDSFFVALRFRQIVKGCHHASLFVRHACETESHFDAAERPGQHEIVEAAQVPDPKNPALQFREACSERHVKVIENDFSEPVGIVTLRDVLNAYGVSRA